MMAVSVVNSTGDSAEGDSSVLQAYSSPPTYVQVILIILYGIVVLVAVGGNMLVCYIVLAFQRMRTVTNFFLLNLAFSDILMAILCIPFTFVSNVMLPYWPFGLVMCPIVTYVQCVSVFLSAFTLVAMSMDRYVAVMYPLRPKLTKKQALGIIAITWVLAVAAPLPTAITSRVLEQNDSDHNSSADLSGLCQEEWQHDYQRYSYTMAIMLLQYFIPLAVLIFTYGRIGYVVWIKEPPGEAVKNRDQRLAASKRKMVKMMIAMVLIYAICWLPLHAITIAGDQNQSIYNEDYIYIFWMGSHWLSMSHCCYNPIVYFSMNSKFRAGFKKVFKCCGCHQEQQLINNFSSRFYHGSTYTTTISLNKVPMNNVTITRYYNKCANERESSEL